MNTVQVYDPKQDAWSNAPDLPTPRDHLAAATDTDGRIYAIGGQTGAGGTPTDTVEVYTPSTGEWAAGPSLPRPMGAPGAARGTDGKIYVLDATTLAVYDPDTGDWSTAAAPPSANGAPVLAGLPDGRILAVGGNEGGNSSGTGTGTGTGTEASSEAYAYTPGTGSTGGSWSQVADLPTGVAEAAGATGPDGRVYIVGGRDGDGDVVGSTQVFTPDDDRWSMGPSSALTTRAGHGAATGGDGRVYVAGGTSGSGAPLDSAAALGE